MTDQPDTIDPIERMPPQLQAANRAKRSKGGMGNPPSEPALQPDQGAVDADQPPPWFTAWLAGQKQAASQFVPSQPEREPQVTTATDEELTEWQRGVRERHQVPPTPKEIKHDRPYNYPMKWFLKADGSIVQLQGDPGNFRYYVDKKKFHPLSDKEVREYLTVEQPRILELQRTKAALINAIRRAAERYRDLSLETTFDDYSIDEIREYLKQIKEETGKDIRVIVPKRQKAREDAEDARMLAGLEMNQETQESLHAKISAGRTIEVTPQNVNQFK